MAPASTKAYDVPSQCQWVILHLDRGLPDALHPQHKSNSNITRGSDTPSSPPFPLNEEEDKSCSVFDRNELESTKGWFCLTVVDYKWIKAGLCLKQSRLYKLLPATSEESLFQSLTKMYISFSQILVI